MTWQVLRLAVPIRFPSGLAAGEGKDGNLSSLARDGKGRPVLRGSAVAGVLRHAYASVARASSDVDRWFGSPQATARGSATASRLVVEDLAFADAGVTLRTHNAIDRHRGAPLDGGLFSIEALAPGVSGVLILVLWATADELGDAAGFMQTLVDLLADGLTLGGSAARGIGRVELADDALLRRFDLATLGDHGAWLDEEHASRRNSRPTTGERLSPRPLGRRLSVEFSLRIPRGQEVLFGGGEGCEFAIEPQRVISAAGQPMLRFPGSALRGVLRGWVARLARREGHAIADSHARAVRRQEEGVELDGESLGWGFAPPELATADTEIAESCPVLRLFGSLRGRGRVLITDAVVPLERAMLQARKHVSVDRITGGASEGFLFDSQQVVSLGRTGAVTFRMTVDSPSDDEARWLADALRAIHLGVLRVGSSKSAGRFELASPPTARGPGAAFFGNMI